MSDRLQPRRGIRLIGGAESWQRPLGATLSPVRRRLRGALFALFGFLLGCVLFDRVIMPRVVRLGDEIDVPEVVGLSLDDAKKKLADTDLKATTAPGRYSNEIPRGQVLLSLPQSGSRVKRNRQVELTLSLGAEDRRIPQLLGQSIRMARIELQERGLRSGAIVYAATEEMSPDQVMAMSPAGGAAMDAEQAVSFLVSKSGAKRAYALPNLRGLKEREAARWLKQNGFGVSYAEESGSGEGWFVVLTDPPPGGMLWPRSTVRLTTDTAELFPDGSNGQDQFDDAGGGDRPGGAGRDENSPGQAPR